MDTLMEELKILQQETLACLGCSPPQEIIEQEQETDRAVTIAQHLQHRRNFVRFYHR